MTKNTIYAIAGGTLAVVGLTALVAFAVWRYDKYRQLPPPAQAVLLRDPSDSGLGGCNEFTAMAGELLSSNLLGSGSAIAVMTTGDSSTAQEPVLLDSLEIPTSPRISEGRAKIADKQKELLAKVKEQCERKGQTKESPIYLGMRRATEYLRAKGCNGKQDCILYVQSDLEELSEPKIKELLKENSLSGKKQSAMETQLPLLIDNAGINVKICGISETTGTITNSSGKQQTFTSKRDGRRADRITEVWTKLFTNPQMVTFNTHCPKD
jgi:heat shock protein HslJ